MFMTHSLFPLNGTCTCDVEITTGSQEPRNEAGKLLNATMKKLYCSFPIVDRFLASLRGHVSAVYQVRNPSGTVLKEVNSLCLLSR